MNLPKIHFKYDFYKLRGQTTARLLDVELVTRNELDHDIVALDVQYYVDVPLENDPDTTQKECRQAKLPNGNLVVLYFTGNKRIPFTVIIKSREKKVMTYREQAKIKQEFEIIITDGIMPKGAEN